MAIKGLCPICETTLEIKDGTQVSEIVSCPECQSLLVVDDIQENQARLNQAPQIEEDWGQ